MPTRRIPLQHQTRLRVTPAALQAWKIILELKQQPRNVHGELCEADRIAEREAVDALAGEMGFCRLTIEPHRIDGDEPWRWIWDNSVQRERWALGKQIRDQLNAALLAQSQKIAAG
jgi:hypothetical protein